METKEPNDTSKTPPKKPASISIQRFAREMAERNGKFFDAVMMGIDSGELKLTGVDTAPDIIDSVIEQWADDDAPTRDMHLQLMSAVFLWMVCSRIKPELFAETDSDDELEPEPAVNGQTVDSALELGIEVVKTIRSIWGIKHG